MGFDHTLPGLATERRPLARVQLTMVQSLQWTFTVLERRTFWNRSGKLRQPSSASTVPPLRSRMTGLM